jgi:hypothetical protein
MCTVRKKHVVWQWSVFKLCRNLSCFVKQYGYRECAGPSKEEGVPTPTVSPGAPGAPGVLPGMAMFLSGLSCFLTCLYLSQSACWNYNGCIWSTSVAMTGPTTRQHSNCHLIMILYPLMLQSAVSCLIQAKVSVVYDGGAQNAKFIRTLCYILMVCTHLLEDTEHVKIPNMYQNMT